MTFDIKKFEEAKFKDRTEEVPVPELVEFFDDPDPKKTIWIVRQLAGEELAIAKEAQGQNRNMESIIEALSGSLESMNQGEKVTALKDVLGVTSETAPDDYVWRLACLRMGSVEPVIDEALAVKIAITYGNVFYRLTNKILALTGMGKTLGE